MRVLVMFDMPTKTKEDRKSSALFRNRLLKDGYFMMQFSVYIRVCRGLKSAQRYLEKLELVIPKKGHIRALILTEKQFENMKVLIGKQSLTEEKQKPIQLTFF